MVPTPTLSLSPYKRSSVWSDSRRSAIETCQDIHHLLLAIRARGYKKTMRAGRRSAGERPYLTREKVGGILAPIKGGTSHTTRARIHLARPTIASLGRKVLSNPTEDRSTLAPEAFDPLPNTLTFPTPSVMFRRWTRCDWAASRFVSAACCSNMAHRGSEGNERRECQMKRGTPVARTRSQLPDHEGRA